MKHFTTQVSLVRILALAAFITTAAGHANAQLTLTPGMTTQQVTLVHFGLVRFQASPGLPIIRATGSNINVYSCITNGEICSEYMSDESWHILAEPWNFGDGLVTGYIQNLSYYPVTIQLASAPLVQAGHSFSANNNGPQNGYTMCWVAVDAGHSVNLSVSSGAWLGTRTVSVNECQINPANMWNPYNWEIICSNKGLPWSGTAYTSPGSFYLYQINSPVNINYTVSVNH